MRKLLLAAAAAAAMTLGVSAAHAEYYSAIAASDGRSVGFAQGYGTMESARDAAIAKCRQYGGSCSVSTADDMSWSYGLGYCNGKLYTAGSQGGGDGVFNELAYKGSLDNKYSCSLTLWYDPQGYVHYPSPGVSPSTGGGKY